MVFKKEFIPWNKGKKGIQKANRTTFKKGQVPWNKGKKGLQRHSQEWKDMMKKIMSKENLTEETKIKRTNGLKKAHLEGKFKHIYSNPQWLQKQRLHQLGKHPPTEFKKGHHINKGIKKSPEHMEKLRLCHLGKKQSDVTKMKRSIFMKKHMENPENVRRRLARRSKSSLEIKFEDIINRLGLPYRFVGNGEIIIARKVPDFINSNGEKIAIEVYYKKHKEKFRGGYEKWKADRIKIFNENGYELLFFDELQVKEEIINQRLGGIQNRNIK